MECSHFSVDIGCIRCSNLLLQPYVSGAVAAAIIICRKDRRLLLEQRYGRCSDRCSDVAVLLFDTYSFIL